MTNCIMKPKKVLPIRVIFYDNKTCGVSGVYYFESLDEIAKLVDLDRVYLTINKVSKGNEYIDPQDDPGPGDVYTMDYVYEGNNQASKAFFIVDNNACDHDDCITNHARLLWFRANINVIGNKDNPRDSISLQIFILNDYGIPHYQVASMIAKASKYNLDAFEDYEKILDKYILQFASAFNPSSIFKIKEEDSDRERLLKMEEEDACEFI